MLDARLFQAALRTSAVFALLPAAATAQFTGLVVFGDSLSDPGNSPAGTQPPAYFGERFTNGPVWTERLAPALGLGPGQVANFALGLQTTGDVLQDVLGYVLQPGVETGALHVVWAGPNDLLALQTGADPTAVVGAAVANTLVSVSLLHAAGVQNILVPDLPDVSLTPRIRGTFGSAILTFLYNDTLALEERSGI